MPRKPDTFLVLESGSWISVGPSKAFPGETLVYATDHNEDMVMLRLTDAQIDLLIGALIVARDAAREVLLQ
jgi:hypothetical protein